MEKNIKRSFITFGWAEVSWMHSMGRWKQEST